MRHLFRQVWYFGATPDADAGELRERVYRGLTDSARLARFTSESVLQWSMKNEEREKVAVQYESAVIDGSTCFMFSIDEFDL